MNFRIAPTARKLNTSGVHFTRNIRSWDDEHIVKSREMEKEEFEVIIKRRGCPIHTEECWKVEHAPFDMELRDRVVESSDELGDSTFEWFPVPVMTWVKGIGVPGADEVTLKL